MHQSCLPANPPRQVWPENSGGASTARGTTLRKERVPGLGRFPLQFQTHHFAPLEGAALCANGEDQRGARGQSRTRLGTFLNSSINSTIAEAAVQSGPALHSDEGQRRAGVGPGLYRLETRRQGAGPPAPQPPGEHLGVHQPVGAEGTQATRSEGGTGARRCSGLSTVQTGVVGSSTPPGASRTPRWRYTQELVGQLTARARPEQVAGAWHPGARGWSRPCWLSSPRPPGAAGVSPTGSQTQAGKCLQQTCSTTR